ncbi:hypothetical protein EVAR_98639_1 [Eumeta japonica]|uniref:Uncharacterized protein n=1 Tax=Eumeta variegata TaxID=151549 RepID=A0A4C1XZH6_EUMVA|nr:hypothetical protein EVAR_98639_1 [Eumeta japonica]
MPFPTCDVEGISTSQVGNKKNCWPSLSCEFGSVASESVTAGRPRARRPPPRALAPSATGGDRFADNSRSCLRGPYALLTSFRAVFYARIYRK